MSQIVQATMALVFSLVFAAASNGVHADAGHSSEGTDDHGETSAIEDLRESHQAHEHGHDFEAIEEMSPEQADRMFELLRDVGLALPPMDAGRGRALFVNKGCVICHSVNGVGAEIGPSLDAADMPSPMNVFEFAARMWRGASAMAAMQEYELGGVIGLTGQELADLIAFAHDAEEQAKLTESQIPEEFRERATQ